MSTFADTYLAANASNLPTESIPMLHQRLSQLTETQQAGLFSVELKSPTIALVLSLFLGSFGVDRFYIGNIGLGVAKLILSWWTLGIWQIVDWFLIMGATKRANLMKLEMAISMVQYRS